MNVNQFKIFQISFLKIIVLSIILFSLTSCTEPELLPDPVQAHYSTFYGQVYNLSHPGPIPVDWTPPPYEAVCTVIAEDVQQKRSFIATSDFKGRFQINVLPGVYYFRVKQSLLSSEAGPYPIKEGEFLTVKAYYDNGMR